MHHLPKQQWPELIDPICVVRRLRWQAVLLTLSTKWGEVSDCKSSEQQSSRCAAVCCSAEQRDMHTSGKNFQCSPMSAHRKVQVTQV